jgi:FGGY family of carbohydrate kinases, N-terminal domain/Endoribonuclease L-PSP
MAEMKSGSTAEGPYLLGMDVGTSSVRVGIFDCKVNPIVFEGVELETRHPRPGRAEQDPETWWSGLATETRRALAAGGAGPEHIIKWNIYVVQGQSLQAGFAAFQNAWPEVPNPPAITGVFVSGLAHPDFLVEMDAVAVVPQ